MSTRSAELLLRDLLDTLVEAREGGCSITGFEVDLFAGLGKLDHEPYVNLRISLGSDPQFRRIRGRGYTVEAAIEDLLGNAKAALQKNQKILRKLQRKPARKRRTEDSRTRQEETDRRIQLLKTLVKSPLEKLAEAAE